LPRAISKSARCGVSDTESIWQGH